MCHSNLSQIWGSVHSVPDESSGGNFTPAVKAEVSSDAPVVEPEAEPIEA
jgi:hypothetical protein